MLNKRNSVYILLVFALSLLSFVYLQMQGSGLESINTVEVTSEMIDGKSMPDVKIFKAILSRVIDMVVIQVF